MKTLKKAYNYLPISLQNLACTTKGYQLKQKRYPELFFKRLNFFEKSINWSEDKLQNYQLKRFNKVLDYAVHNVPFYKKLFDNKEIPDQINEINELKNFPIIEKEQLRKNPEKFTTEKRQDIYTTISTSGSTGTPLKIKLTKLALVESFAAAWRLRRQYGAKFNAPNATFNGRQVVPQKQDKPPFWRYNKAFNQTLFSQYHVNEENLKYYIEKLTSENFNYWIGYPSFINLIAQGINQTSVSLKKPPEVIQTSSETLTVKNRRDIQEATDSIVKQRYSAAESCVSMTECSENNFHVDREIGVVELTNIIKENEQHKTGELIVTGLNNLAMPLIRYKIGDVATMRKQGCECNRAGPVFESIDGRKEDYIITPDGKKIGRVDHIFKGDFNVKEAQIIQEEAASIKVRLVKASGYNEKEESKIREEIINRIGQDFKVNFQYLDKIPRLENGKFRAVINNYKD